MKIEIEVIKINVTIMKYRPDCITIITKLPDGCWPHEGNASFSMYVAHGSGADYVRCYFGIEPEVRDFSKD